jgi:hypothetical protein
VSDASSNASTIVRRAFLKIDPAMTLRAVDTLDLRARAKVSAVVGVPLRQLQQRRDVGAFATTAPLAALKSLLDVLALAPLERIVAYLGDHAESPTYDQLARAVDQLIGSGSSFDDAVAALAYAIGESFPAAPSCRRLLEERAELALPALPEVIAPTILASPREVNPEIREQRRARRDEEKRRRKTNSPPRALRVSKPKSGAPPRPDVSVRALGESPSPTNVERRRAPLTPLELSRFDADHPLVGAVLELDVSFEGHDPAQPEATSKDRPVLVVASSSEALLVRPIYSSPSTARTIFQPWRRVGLDHVSFIDGARVVVPYVPGATLRHLGHLTAREWNALG